MKRWCVNELRKPSSQMESLQDDGYEYNQAPPAVHEKDAFVNAPFEGWESYPTNLNTYDPTITNGEYYNSHLRDLSSTLFCSLPSSTRVDIIDVYGEKQKTRNESPALKLKQL